MPITDVSKAKIAWDGGLFSASVDTAFPTTMPADKLVPATFEGWGVLSQDNVTRSLSKSTTDIKGWQKSVTIATIVESGDGTFTIPAMESRKHIVEAAFNTTIDPATGKYEIDPAALGVKLNFIFETINYVTGLKEWQMFTAQVTEVGDVTYSATEAVVLSLTLKVIGKITVIDEAFIEAVPAA